MNWVVALSVLVVVVSAASAFYVDEDEPYWRLSKRAADSHEHYAPLQIKRGRELFGKRSRMIVEKKKARELFGKRSMPASILADDFDELGQFDGPIVRLRRARTSELFGR